MCRGLGREAGISPEESIQLLHDRIEIPPQTLGFPLLGATVRSGATRINMPNGWEAPFPISYG
jgi:hypothetical protein